MLVLCPLNSHAHREISNPLILNIFQILETTAVSLFGFHLLRFSWFCQFCEYSFTSFALRKSFWLHIKHLTESLPWPLAPGLGPPLSQALMAPMSALTHSPECAGSHPPARWATESSSCAYLFTLWALVSIITSDTQLVHIKYFLDLWINEWSNMNRKYKSVQGHLSKNNEIIYSIGHLLKLRVN